MKHALLRAMVGAGFTRQIDFAAATKAHDAEGVGVPQPVISRMLRGSRCYPRAIEIVARTLDVKTTTVERWIAESRREAEAPAAD